jgi:iron(III) transport system substrate-binding protein
VIPCHEAGRPRRGRILFVLAALLLGCGRSADVLHVYTSLDAQEAPVYIDAFERETGVRVRLVRLSAGEALARLEAERNNPQVSVWFGGPAPEYIVASSRGLLEPFAPDAEYDIGDVRGRNGDWTGFYTGVIGFICNEEVLARLPATCPTTWHELLQPALRGQISVAYPYTSGTAYIIVVALLEQFGEEQGWDFIRRLNGQIHRYNSSGSAAVTQVGLGEAAVGLAFSHDILKKGVERGYPVRLSVPRDGTAPEVGAVAIVRGAPEPQLAQQFVNWLLSERAQNLLAQFYRVPLHPRAEVAAGAVRPGEVNVIEYDAEEAAAAQQRILAQWRQVTGR